MMSDYKLDAAKACMKFIKPSQTIGLGAGTTIANLITLICEDQELVESLYFVSSSFKTILHLKDNNLKILSSTLIDSLDIYFDGCDQFDKDLNALKSGGGIHTREKILASMAREFILMGDESKSVEKLDHTYPLVIELLHEALPVIFRKISKDYPDASFDLRMSTQKDGAVISENGNLLADLRFPVLPELAELNSYLKMIPGVVEHSLFYNMATQAVVAGSKGISILHSASSLHK
jgi:ribose 5-phosphate isomerase A